MIDGIYIDFYNDICINPDEFFCINCSVYMKCKLSREYDCSCKKGKEDPNCEFHKKMEMIIIIKSILNRGITFYDEYYNKLEDIDKIVTLKRSGKKVLAGKDLPDNKWNIGYM